MINVQFVGRKIKLRQDFKDFAQKKLDALVKFDPEDRSTMFVEVEVSKNKHHKKGDRRHQTLDEGLTLQISFWVENTPIRAEESGSELQDLFDKALGRIKVLLEQHDIQERHFSRKARSAWTKRKK